MCRASKPQAQLVRLAGEGGALRLDLTRRLGGRGTWVCLECAAGTNEKRLRAAFKGNAQEVARLLSQALSHSAGAHPTRAPAGRGNTVSSAQGEANNQDHGGLNV